MDVTGTLWQGLLANLAAVALLTMIWTQFMPFAAKLPARGQTLIFGTVMGLGAILVMAMPFQTEAGFQLDHRFTLIGVAAFFGGPLSMMITSAMALGFQLYLGGIGLDIGCLGIVLSSGIGLGMHSLTPARPQPPLWYVLLFSLAVPLGMLAGLFRPPHGLWPAVPLDVAVPLAATLFLATLLCTLAILQEQQRLAATKSAAIYEAIINALPDCLNVKDLDGRFIAANPSTARLMRARDKRALIGKTDFDFYPADIADTFRRDEIEVLAAKSALTIDQMIARPDGSLTYLSTLKAPLHDDDGLVIGLITHNRDVTEKRALERDLGQVRQTLDDAITNMSDGLAIFDRQGRMIFSNGQYASLYPMTADVRVIGSTFQDIIGASRARGERVYDQAITGWLKTVSADKFVGREDIIVMADGRSLQVKTVSVKDGTLLLVSDITSQKQAEAELVFAASEYRALFENSVAGIFRSTVDGRMLRANPALARLNGFTTERELIDAVNDIAAEWYVDHTRRDEFVALMEAHGRVTDFVSEVYRFKTRERIWISETAWTVRDADARVVCYEGTITEITDRKLAEQALEHANSTLYSLSRTDGLTGLANRRAFDDCLAAEFDRAKSGGTPLSVLMIDVDHFKRFNDTYGHIRGDECLRHIAQVVAAVPRGYGDKACRYGGEEMSVLLPDTDKATASLLAERLRDAVAGMNIAHSGGEEGIVTISIGVATTKNNDAFISPADLVESADRALYTAKADGRNRVVLVNAA